jgi:hypothetical protein
VVSVPKTSDFGGRKQTQSAATAQGLTGVAATGFLADAFACGWRIVVLHIFP